MSILRILFDQHIYIQLFLRYLKEKPLNNLILVVNMSLTMGVAMHIFLSIISIPKQGTAKNHTMEDVVQRNTRPHIIRTFIYM